MAGTTKIDPSKINQNNPDGIVGYDDSTPKRQYNDSAYIWMTREKFGRLRARMLNLMESAARDEVAAKAMKSLVKDFCNDAYYDLIRDLESFAEDAGIKSPKENGSIPPIEEREYGKD